MRPVLVASSAALALALTPAAADAGWSPPVTVAAPHASHMAVAVDRHGHVVLAWASRRRVGGRSRATLDIAMRLATGRTWTRTLWSGASAEVTGVAVGIDRRDRITAAWGSWDPARETPSGVARAASGSVAGRWTTPVRIAALGEGAVALAVAPDGTAVAAFQGRLGTRVGPAAAWRRPGARFGGVQRLALGGPRPGDPDGPRAAFDAAGRAYVWDRCSAAFWRSVPGARRFDAGPVVLAPRALGFGLSVAGRRGVAAWVDGACSSDAMVAPTTGPVRAALLHDGHVAAPVTVSAAGAHALTTMPAALPAGGGSVGWVVADSLPLGTAAATFTSAGAFAALPAPVTRYADAADAAGDLLLAPVAPASGYALRPAGGGADEPGPVAQPGAVTGTSTTGAGAAVAWPTVALPDVQAPGQRLALAVWTP